MPLSNNNFVWRPNDNSSLTNLRYDLEADKWVKAVKGADLKNKPMNLKGDLGAISTFMSLPLLLLFFIILIPIKIIREVFNYNIKVFEGDEPTGRVLSDREKFRARIDTLKKKYPPSKKRERTWEELSDEEKNLVIAVRENTGQVN